MSRLHTCFRVDAARGNDRHADGLDDAPRQFGGISLASEAICKQAQAMHTRHRRDMPRAILSESAPSRTRSRQPAFAPFAASSKH